MLLLLISTRVPAKKCNLSPTSIDIISNFVSSKRSYENHFIMPPISKNFVLRHIISKPNNMAFGLDGLNVEILKRSAIAISCSITNICNLSIQTLFFPSQWKVVPLLKSRDKEECNNYRPISALPLLRNKLEKHISLHFYKYHQHHKLLTDIKN